MMLNIKAANRGVTPFQERAISGLEHVDLLGVIYKVVPSQLLVGLWPNYSYCYSYGHQKPTCSPKVINKPIYIAMGHHLEYSRSNWCKLWMDGWMDIYFRRSKRGLKTWTSTSPCSAIYPLVICYITNWKITMLLLLGKSTINGVVSIAM